MAWEEESIETNLDDDGGGSRKNIVKIALIAGGALALVLLLYFAFAWWRARDKGPVQDQVAATADEEIAVDTEKADAEGAPDPELDPVVELDEDDEADTGYLVHLKRFLLELDDEGKARYFGVNVSIRVSSPALRDALHGDQGGASILIPVRLTLIDYLGGLSYRQLSNTDSRRDAANDIRHKLNKRFGELGKFNKVLLAEDG